MNPGPKEIKEAQIEMHRKRFSGYSKAGLKEVMDDCLQGSEPYFAAQRLLTDMEDAEIQESNRIANNALMESKKSTNWAKRSFWVAVVAAIAAIVAAVASLLPWFDPIPPASLPPQSVVQPTVPMLPNHSASEFHPALPQSSAAQEKIQPPQATQPLPPATSAPSKET
jgi:hypothetical protein